MHTLIPRSAALAHLPVTDSSRSPVTVVGTDAIRSTFDEGCLQQAVNARMCPGVTDVVLNPDGHIGYGAPIGCVMASPTHIYPGPVGVDIKCSMSLLALDLPADAIADKRTRRALIEAICERTPTGAGKGQRSAKKSRRVTPQDGERAVIEGASAEVCRALGIPPEWAEACEDAAHTGHDGSADALRARLEAHPAFPDKMRLWSKYQQLGSYGGGNHFGECEITDVDPAMQDTADAFGLRHRGVAFLSHCGSRGFGHDLASGQFRTLQRMFEKWGLAYPAGDRHLVYAPLGTPEADAYLDDMALGANFATVNHLLINALVMEAFQEVLPGTTGHLVYFISHNIARRETWQGQETWVHRKGATRAYPAGHAGLAGTRFAATGHPILLPGNPRDGSVVMVAQPGAEATCYSVNHGAGRRLGRKAAARTLDQRSVDAEFTRDDILTNCRTYPIDEAPDAYKDFAEVLRSVEVAGLARQVAKLKAAFVIKDGSGADD